MASLPDPSTHVWADLSVGGSSCDPILLKLVEENLMPNGDFVDALSGWSNESGTAPSRVDAGSNAAKGNYVMRLQQSSVTHRYISFTGTKILLTGFGLCFSLQLAELIPLQYALCNHKLLNSKISNAINGLRRNFAIF